MPANPEQCASHLCEMPIGPDALEITHNGKPAGAFCTECLQGAHKLRILLELDKEGTLVATEAVPLS